MIATEEQRLPPQRCVIVVDRALAPGLAANAAAVMALTIGQRHPDLVGAPLVDGAGAVHPGLIPVGIAVLAAAQGALSEIRSKGLAAGCDIVDFPVQGQQTKNYESFVAAVAEVDTADLAYVGVALIGARKPISKVVADLELL